EHPLREQRIVLQHGGRARVRPRRPAQGGGGAQACHHRVGGPPRPLEVRAPPPRPPRGGERAGREPLPARASAPGPRPPRPPGPRGAKRPCEEGPSPAKGSPPSTRTPGGTSR